MNDGLRPFFFPPNLNWSPRKPRRVLHFLNGLYGILIRSNKISWRRYGSKLVDVRHHLDQYWPPLISRFSFIRATAPINSVLPQTAFPIGRWALIYKFWILNRFIPLTSWVKNHIRCFYLLLVPNPELSVLQEYHHFLLLTSSKYKHCEWF